MVVGFGPCGMLAALTLAQMGFRPIVLERGKTVRQRTKDTWGLWRKKVLQPESNVQFGEGGAGTFSDGKLYSQIKDCCNTAAMSDPLASACAFAMSRPASFAA